MDHLKYKCYYAGCEKGFLSKFNLARHVNTVHLEIRPFPCLLCAHSCSSKQNMNSHLRTHLKRLKSGEEVPEGDRQAAIRRLQDYIRSPTGMDEPLTEKKIEPQIIQSISFFLFFIMALTLAITGNLEQCLSCARLF